MTHAQEAKVPAISEPYPKWVVRACDRIANKDDDEPLTNVEAEAAIEYMDGPLMQDA